MKILIVGLGIFFAAFFIHLIIWKIKVPKRGMKILISILFLVLIISINALILFKSINLFDYVQICIFVMSFYLAYITTYSAIEVDSPSLVMINAIAKAGKKGLDGELFYQMMNDDILVKPRIADLLNDKMAYLEGDKYKLTPKGKLMACIFILYRRLLNAPKGG